MKYFPQKYMLTKCLGCEILELFLRIKPKKYMWIPALDHATVQNCNYCTVPISKASVK